MMSSRNWIAGCSKKTADRVQLWRLWYENYEFHRVYHSIYEFASVHLSAFYFDIIKDRLYTKAPNNGARRSAQTAIYKIATALLKIISPILVLRQKEEVWKYIPKLSTDASSVHITLFPAESDLRTNNVNPTAW